MIGVGVGVGANKQSPGSILTGAEGVLRLGPVASRSVIPNNFFNGHLQARSRSIHYAYEDIVALKFVTANYWIDGTTGNKMDSGQPQNDTMALEYPLLSANRAQVTWDGLATGVTAAGALRESDWRYTSIPKGSWFACRRWWSNAGGVAWTSLSNWKMTGSAEAFGSAASGLTDQTMAAGAVSDAGNASNFAGPVAILAMTRKKTVIYIGCDSLVAGLNDVHTASGDFGIFRYLSRNYGYINAARSGDRAMWAKNRDSAYFDLAKYCTHAIVENSINDIANGQSAAQTQDSVVAIGNAVRAVNPNINLALSTLTPDTDAANTAANAGTSAARLTLNAWKRGVPAPFDRVIDLAAVYENSLNGGRWGTTAHQSDGRHTTQAGNLFAIDHASLLQTLP